MTWQHIFDIVTWGIIGYRLARLVDSLISIYKQHQFDKLTNEAINEWNRTFARYSVKVYPRFKERILN
jgi:hypothetical protein